MYLYTIRRLCGLVDTALTLSVCGSIAGRVKLKIEKLTPVASLTDHFRPRAGLVIYN